MKSLLSLAALWFFGALAPAWAQTPAPTPEGLAFFEKRIRPVLSDKCYKCHSERSEKIKGGLVLDTRDGIRRGGDNGAAVVPGKLEESLLIEALRYANKDFAMPPKKSGGKLSAEIIQDFEAWIKMGAPDPRDGPAKVVKKSENKEARNWWAFQPVTKPLPPQGDSWARTDIDRFVAAGYTAKALKPVADADKATLLRRIYFDLIGLPPSPAQIDAFFKDSSPDAFAKVVDKLLASPQFGERWGRHWLDVARYAESTGKDANFTFPYAWRYRDYVIDAFNTGKPYDQFLREQIAGDLLPATDDRARAQQMTATGFLAIGPKGLNEQNPRQFALDLADEQIDTVSQSILGLTVACARCHDHKFDPIPQREYYAMAGIFLSTNTHYGTPRAIVNRHSSDLLELPKAAGLPVLSKTLAAADRATKEKRLEELTTEERELAAERRKSGPGKAQNGPPRILIVATQIGQLETELRAFDESGQSKALAMGVSDQPASQRDGSGFGFGNFQERIRQRFGGRPPEFSTINNSALYARGEVDKPGEKVPRGFVSALAVADAPVIASNSSGRLELAAWLTSKSNPLTARVVTNRVWHWLFGKGLVESTDNFGTTGQKPANPALLDYLATRLMEKEWSLKAIIREIVLSRTYQLSSTFDDRNFVTDPENALMWRMSKRRLDAECIRDGMLAASGKLDLKAPLASLIGESGEGPIGLNRGRGLGEDLIVTAAGNQRSIYLPIARDVQPDALAVFDLAEPSLVTGARETTNVPSQALYMLNSSFVNTQATELAARVMHAYPGGPNAATSANFDQRLLYAYWLVFARAPDAVERRAALDFLTKFPSNWGKNDISRTGLRDEAAISAAWTSLCRALFASAEFRYLN